MSTEEQENEPIIESKAEKRWAYWMGVALAIANIYYKIFAIQKICVWCKLPISLTFSQWFVVYFIAVIINMNGADYVKKEPLPGTSIWMKELKPEIAKFLYVSTIFLIFYLNS